jgi:hypothetical protein
MSEEMIWELREIRNNTSIGKTIIISENDNFSEVKEVLGASEKEPVLGTLEYGTLSKSSRGERTFLRTIRQVIKATHLVERRNDG